MIRPLRSRNRKIGYYVSYECAKSPSVSCTSGRFVRMKKIRKDKDVEKLVNFLQTENKVTNVVLLNLIPFN